LPVAKEAGAKVIVAFYSQRRLAPAGPNGAAPLSPSSPFRCGRRPAAAGPVQGGRRVPLVMAYGAPLGQRGPINPIRIEDVG